jgi:hypothetical protein
MNINREKIIMGTIATGIVFFMIYTHLTKANELDKYGIISIGKMINFGYCSGGSNCGEYEYFYKNKKHTSTFRSERDYSFEKKENRSYKGKYYEILFSKRNPEKSEIHLDIEIINNERIRKVGFE